MPVVLTDAGIAAGAIQVVLDPSEVASARTEVDVTSLIKFDGIDWGDAEIQAYIADQARGSSPVDFRVPNRTVTIPLILRDRDDWTFDEARVEVQAKCALFQQEGGWIKRLLPNGLVVYADVVNATLKLPDSWTGYHVEVEPDVVLTLECIPDFYGDEITLSDHVETTNGELIFTETGILGDYPGRLRLVVDNDQSTDQLGLVACLRCRHYSSAATAALVYTAQSRTALDAATNATVASTSVVRHNNLGTDWTPVLSTQATGGGAHLTHTGSYRVRARVYSTSTTEVKARLLWDVGDFTSPVENAAWTVPAASNFYLADLGEVRLDQVPVGSHRWQGVVQAEGEDGGENLSIARIWFEPLDEGWTLLRAPVNSDVGLAGYSARDEFNQSVSGGSDPLTGKTAAIGGVWAGAGDLGDFVVEDTGHTAQRSSAPDADENTGRYALSGVTGFAAQAVQVDFQRASMSGSGSTAVLHLGVLARYVDVNNWLMATLRIANPVPGTATIAVRKRVAGTVTTLHTQTVSVPDLAAFNSIRLAADAKGQWSVWYWPQGGSAGDAVVGQDSDLATGGALASGKPGFYDANTGTAANARTYDNFKAWAPTSDAAIFASQSAELRWDGHFREDSAGAVYGPVPNVEGDLLRIPPAGLEARTVQVMAKGSRGDFDQIPDSATGDDISARVTYRPSWLFVPTS